MGLQGQRQPDRYNRKHNSEYKIQKIEYRMKKNIIQNTKKLQSQEYRLPNTIQLLCR